MTTDLELKIPGEVLESLPSRKEDMIKHLAKYFDTVIEKYNDRFQKRVSGPMGGEISRYERSLLKDFLIDLTLGKLEDTNRFAAETLTADS